MQELTTTATLVEYGMLEDGGSIAAVLERSELEAALGADESAELWLELAGAAETMRLTLALTSADVEEILRSSLGDEVTLALDADTVAGLFADPDVEAHGLRGALAIAVATAAIAAPAGLAATPQGASPAATPQVSSQVSSQVSGAAATTQVSSQVSRAAAKGQVKALVSKTQVHQSLVVRAAGVTILRGGLAQ